MEILNSILLQRQAEGGGMSGMLMIIAMIAIFYFYDSPAEQKAEGNKESP